MQLGTIDALIPDVYKQYVGKVQQEINQCQARKLMLCLIDLLPTQVMFCGSDAGVLQNNMLAVHQIQQLTVKSNAIESMRA